MSATGELIAFVQQLDAAQLSDLLLQQAKRCVFDLKGDPKNPLSDAELLEKFRTLTVGIVGQDRIAALKDAVDRLDQIKDVRELTQLLSI